MTRLSHRLVLIRACLSDKVRSKKKDFKEFDSPVGAAVVRYCNRVCPCEFLQKMEEKEIVGKGRIGPLESGAKRSNFDTEF